MHFPPFVLIPSLYSGALAEKKNEQYLGALMSVETESKQMRISHNVVLVE